MPSPSPYIPAKNANLIAWVANFSTLITAAPATYGLTAGDAAVIAAINATLSADWTVITSPTTKTAAAVAAFNGAKASGLPTLRSYAQSVANNAGVTSANKIALGLNPRTSTPAPITTPTTSPILSAQSASTAGILLRYRDATASPTSKAKPYGVTGLQLFATASATVITDPSLLTFVGTITKSPTQLSLPGTSGKVAYIAARWITRKGLVGPWSPLISFVSVQP